MHTSHNRPVWPLQHLQPHPCSPSCAFIKMLAHTRTLLPLPWPCRPADVCRDQDCADDNEKCCSTNKETFSDPGYLLVSSASHHHLDPGPQGAAEAGRPWSRPRSRACLLVDSLRRELQFGALPPARCLLCRTSRPTPPPPSGETSLAPYIDPCTMYFTAVEQEQYPVWGP